MNDVCIYSIVFKQGEDTVQSNIYIIQGDIRNKLLVTLAMHCGQGCTVVADMLGRSYLRRLLNLYLFDGCDKTLPHIMYTRWMLKYCSERVRRDVFGISKSMRCRVCGDRTGWGLDMSGNPTCINEWLTVEADQYFQRLQNRQIHR